MEREDIMGVTLALADERGLSAVSMRPAATRVGVTAMSLYHYVRDKDDMPDGLVERLLAELPLPDPCPARSACALWPGQEVCDADSHGRGGRSPRDRIARSCGETELSGDNGRVLRRYA